MLREAKKHRLVVTVALLDATKSKSFQSTKGKENLRSIVLVVNNEKVNIIRLRLEKKAVATATITINTPID